MDFSLPGHAPTLRGERVTLSQLGLHVIDDYLDMLADEQVAFWTGTKKRFSREQIQEWLTTRASQTDRLDWAVFDNETGEFAGEVVLNEYDPKRHAMNVRIALRSEFHNRGLGTEAMRFAVEHALETAKLSKVTLSVLIDNHRAQRSYQKIGFVPGRQYNDGASRYQRMSIDRFDYVRAQAEFLINQHLTDAGHVGWTFEFDSAKRRAGLCSYTDKRISVSKYLVTIHSLDETHQVLLHEVAHALSGKREGHSKKWLATAKSIGYRGERFSGDEIAREQASWVGYCPAGHEYFRYRKPKGVSSCGICSRAFDNRNLIRWQQRQD